MHRAIFANRRRLSSAQHLSSWESFLSRVLTVSRREWPLFFPPTEARKRPGRCCKLQLPWSTTHHHQLFPSGEPTQPSHRISRSNFSSCPVPFASPAPSLSPASASLASSFPSTPSKFPPNCPVKNSEPPTLQRPRHQVSSCPLAFTPRSAGPTGPTRPKMKAMNGPSSNPWHSIDMPPLRLGDATRYHDGQFQPLPRCTVASLPRWSTVEITQRKDPTGIAAHPYRAVEETRVRFPPVHWTLARNKTAAR